MNDRQIQRIVAEVLKRLLPQMGANGERGNLIVVFTGATAGCTEAIQEVRSLVMKGFHVQLAFSRGAELLYGPWIWEQMEGFPQVDPIEESKWLRTLKDSRGVIVPLLSVNTLSKLSLLVADNLASNLILHALFMGKPVILAQNGVDPSDKGRVELHFDKCGPGLAAAIEERIEGVRSYGCQVLDVAQVSAALESALEQKPAAVQKNGRANGAASRPKGNIITAADVLQAQQTGRQIVLRSSTVVTPLARELASKHGISLAQDGLLSIQREG
jgi:hypothetical protein